MDSIKVAMDTVVTRAVDPELLQHYADIVEKTNQQLSLWTNPYGLMVGLLGVLFTIVTIASAVILYRQSKDYKNQALEIVRFEAEKYFAPIVKSYSDRLAELEVSLKEKQTQDAGTATEDEKKRLETKIDQIEQEKKNLQQLFKSNRNFFNLETVAPNSFYYLCKNCKHPVFSPTVLSDTYACPICGSRELEFIRTNLSGY